MDKLDKDKIDRLREGFKGHPFFLYVSSAYDALHTLCGDDLRFMESEAQLFYDASLLLDHIISPNGIAANRLWTDLRADYHSAIAVQSESINKEIAMLVYVVAYSVCKVPGLKGMIGLSETLLNLIRKYLNDDEQMDFSIAMHKASKGHNNDLDAWLEDSYSVNTLALQVNDVLNTRKAKAKKKIGALRINDDDAKTMIQDLLDKLVNTYHYVREDEKERFRRLLSGQNISEPIHWPRDYKTLLGSFLQGMRAIIIGKDGKRRLIPVGERGEIKEEQRLVVTTNGTDFWTDIVNKKFLDENGLTFKGLKNVRLAKKDMETCDDLLSAFDIIQPQRPSKF